MREQLKQQFKDMMGILARGETVIYSKIRDKDIEILNELFEDMQNTAIAIGTTIEQVEGEGTETVRHLEEYCDLIWQYMTQEERNERYHIFNLLEEKRKEVLRTLDTEFQGRLEIAFFVCRGASWKHMERFFHIMKDKADCYVVTVHYMERTVLGPNAAIRDESWMIPEDVETRTLGEYDIREQMPDMVFVDGPFVEAGQLGLTPGYDFAEVRENAGVVLYMPYYEDESQVEEAHCQNGQVRDADMILLPSETVCSTYKKVMGQMKDGKSLIKKLYVLDALNEEALVEKGLKKKR